MTEEAGRTSWHGTGTDPLESLHILPHRYRQYDLYIFVLAVCGAASMFPRHTDQQREASSLRPSVSPQCPEPRCWDGLLAPTESATNLKTDEVCLSRRTVTAIHAVIHAVQGLRVGDSAGVVLPGSPIPQSRISAGSKRSGRPRATSRLESDSDRPPCCREAEEWQGAAPESTRIYARSDTIILPLYVLTTKSMCATIGAKEGRAHMNVKEIEGTFEDCAKIAMEVARDTCREAVPVRVFNQGPRRMMSAVLPVRVLLRVLYSEPARKGMGTNVSRLNRPVDAKHVKSIFEYLSSAIRENRPYILPPLTLNVTTDAEVYVPKGRAITSGWAILPEGHCMAITDGQHRFLAIRKVAEELHGTEEGNNFSNNGIPVMVTLSSSTEEAHQDFADAAKTKPLPPSLVAVYDLRHPGNAAVMRLTERVKLLQGRVDATSTTLSINSPYIFLVNQIRQFVKSSLTNNPAATNATFYTQAMDALHNSRSFEDWVQSRISFLEVLTEIIPTWKEISTLPKPQGPESHMVLSRMKEIRSRQTVDLSVAALSALGLVSWALLSSTTDKVKTATREALRQRLAPLEAVDWRRSAAIWKGSIVEDGRILNRGSAVRTAASKLMQFISEGSACQGDTA